MFYDEFRGILEDIATENGALVHPNVGKGKGRRSIKVEAFSCPALNHECAPSPEAMIDRLQELIGVEFVEMKEYTRWNQYARHQIVVRPRMHADKVEWTKLPHPTPTKVTLIERTPLTNFLFEKNPPEEFTKELNVRLIHFRNTYRRCTGHLFDSANPRNQQWAWSRAVKAAVQWYIRVEMRPETKWLIQVVLSKELSRLEPRTYGRRLPSQEERAEVNEDDAPADAND